MAIKEEIMFLIGLYKKLQGIGTNTAKVNEVFVEIVNMPEMKSKYGEGALEVICEMYDFTITNGKVKTKTPSYSGSSRGGC